MDESLIFDKECGSDEEVDGQKNRQSMEMEIALRESPRTEGCSDKKETADFDVEHLFLEGQPLPQK